MPSARSVGLVGGTVPSSRAEPESGRATRWSPEAGHLVLGIIDDLKEGMERKQWLVHIARKRGGADRQQLRDRVARDKASASARALATHLVAVHLRRIVLAKKVSPERAMTKVTALDRGLRRAVSGMRKVAVRTLPRGPPPPAVGVATFESLSPHLDRSRPASEVARVEALSAIKAFPWPSDGTPSVIVPSRALKRARSEHQTQMTPQSTRGLVHRLSLPTATANSSDCYFWLHRLEYFTVEELSRAFGIKEGGALWSVLCRERSLSFSVIASALGRAVHVTTAKYVWDLVLARSPVKITSYGSMYSGIDTLAEGLEQSLPTRWKYRFAADLCKSARTILAKAWRHRGLSPAHVYDEASDPRLTSEAPRVSALALSPECGEYSDINLYPSRERRASGLRVLSKALGYVERARPSVILVENVHSTAAFAELSSLLLNRAPGYRWEYMVICPFQHLGIPVHRRRGIWIGELE